MTLSTATHGGTGAGWRRVATYLHLQELVAGRDVVEVWSAPADPRGWQTLAARGARQITVVAPESVKRGSDEGRGKQAQRQVGDARRTGLAPASVEVLFALDIDAAQLREVVAEARRVLRPDGVFVLGVASKDRPSAPTDSASYYDVVDGCAVFSHVRMLGIAPFAGTTLVEYGVKDPEPILDGTLVERGERVDYYVAVAGPERRTDFGYGVVQIPVDALAPVDGKAANTEDPELRNALSRAEAQIVELQRRPSAPAAPAPVVKDPQVAELRRTLDLHAAEMRARELELIERDAYIKEIEHHARQIHELEGRVVRTEAQRADVESAEREARKKIATLEGMLRTNAAVGGASDDVTVLKQKLADAESEAWKHLRARSDAEAAATELREDNQRKLKDARKLAQVELMRAMEEATKKAISLRDDLERSERLRKAALAELEQLKSIPDAGHKREVARAKEEVEAAARASQAVQTRTLGELEAARLAAENAVREAEARGEQMRDRMLGLERSLAEVERERDGARQALAVERASIEEVRRSGAVAPTPSSSAVERGRLEAERERALQEQTEELVSLRGQLVRQAQKITALERDRPARNEVDQVRGELERLRARVAELGLELQRRDVTIERTAAAAAHERARAERFVADGRQALAERNDARARVAESTARVAGLESDKERALATLAQTEVRAQKAESDLREKRERVRQLKRELEDSERRAEYGISKLHALDSVRARVHALETAVLGEAARLAVIETALRA